MSAQNISSEAELWGKLYALLCRWPTVRDGLANMPDADQPKFDDLAEEIIAVHITTEPKR